MNQIHMPVDYHVWNAVIECYHRYTPKTTNAAVLNAVLFTIWNDSPQKFIDIKAILSIHNRLRLCVTAADKHSKRCLITE